MHDLIQLEKGFLRGPAARKQSFDNLSHPISISITKPFGRCAFIALSSFALMYNGIGLATSRGTATSGYVQRNLAFVRPKTKRETFEQQRAAQAAQAPEVRRPNAAIIEHERRRKVETKVFELGETLRSQSYVLAFI